MPLFGSHLSIAGGYYKAVDSAAEHGMDCVQIFTKNNNQWNGKPLSDEDVRLFREAVEKARIRKACAHDSYLINLASPNEALWTKSLEAFVIELQRAETLGLVGVVMHPGSTVDSSEAEGIARVIQALDRALEQTADASVEIWLETTAGQGTALGHRFEHLRDILGGLKTTARVGVCIDTCHIFAAGYPIISRDDYKATMDRFDALVGLDRVRAFHLNDSKREFGSRVDRHAHIGQGHLGTEAFRNIVNDSRFADHPMYLETPKGFVDGESLDARNLAILKGLLKATKRRPYKRKSR